MDTWTTTCGLPLLFNSELHPSHLGARWTGAQEPGGSQVSLRGRRSELPIVLQGHGSNILVVRIGGFEWDLKPWFWRESFKWEATPFTP